MTLLRKKSNGEDRKRRSESVVIRASPKTPRCRKLVIILVIILKAVTALPSPRWQVTKNVTTKADEDNAVPGRIAAAPFDFSVGHYDPRTNLNMLCPAELFIVTCVGDDGDILIALHLIAVSPISVSLAAAIDRWVVRLLQFTEPLSDWRINVIPLTKVTCWSLGNGKDKHCRPQSPQ